MKLLCSFLLFICLAGCANDYEKLEAEFYTGNYLEAGQFAIEGVQHQAHRKKIHTFLNKHGDYLIDKAFLQASILCKRYQSDAGIQYLYQLIETLETFKIIGFQIQSLDDTLQKSEDLLLEAITKYATSQAILGIANLENKKYRAAIPHFEEVLKYKPDNQDIQEKLADATKMAQVHLTIQPLYTPAKLLPDLVSETFYGLFQDRVHANQGNLKVTSVLHGINVDKRFQQELMTKLNKNKSTYLTLSTEDKTTNIHHGHYILKGVITAAEVDNSTFPVRITKFDRLRYRHIVEGIEQWDSTEFSYDVISLEYKVTIGIDAQLIDPYTQQIRHQFTFEKTTSTERSYKDTDPDWMRPSGLIEVQYPLRYQSLIDNPIPIDRTELINDAIDQATEQLTLDILKAIDS